MSAAIVVTSFRLETEFCPLIEYPVYPFDDFCIVPEGYIVHTVNGGSLCSFFAGHWLAEVYFPVEWNCNLVLVHYDGTVFESSPVEHVEHYTVFPGDLSKEIDEAMQTLPSYLAESIDAIRHIGNFAAHPNKSTSTGQIVDVEIGEAEWALDVLEDLFDFYYVQPAITQRKKDAMNEKLKDLGKPPLKKPN